MLRKLMIKNYKSVYDNTIYLGLELFEILHYADFSKNQTFRVAGVFRLIARLPVC